MLVEIISDIRVLSLLLACLHQHICSCLKKKVFSSHGSHHDTATMTSNPSGPDLAGYVLVLSHAVSSTFVQYCRFSLEGCMPYGYMTAGAIWLYDCGGHMAI